MNNNRIIFVSFGVKFFCISVGLWFLGSHYYENNYRPSLNQLIDFNGINTPNDINALDVDGYTPLQKATVWGDVPTALSLINSGANLDAQANSVDQRTGLKSRNTALDFAIFNGDSDECYQIADMLLQAGASVRIANVLGDRPLHFLMIQMTNFDRRFRLMVQMIMRGADINAQNNMGNTQAHMAVYRNDRSWIELLRISFGSLVNFNLTNDRGLTPRQLADSLYLTDVLLAFDEVKQVVIGSNNDVNAIDPVTGMTALMLAAIRGDRPFILNLLRRGAYIDARVNDNDQNTALQILLLFQNVSMLQLLLDQGANPNLANAYGDTPLHYIMRIDSVDKPMATMINLRIQALQALMSKNANINAQNNIGNTLLHLAVYNNAIDLINNIVQNYGALVNPNLRNNQGLTPIMIARELNLPFIVQELSVLDTIPRS